MAFTINFPGSPKFFRDLLNAVRWSGGFIKQDDETEAWEDLRFPLTGRNLDVASGRLDYDFYNGSVGFQNNARFILAETVSFLVQLPHSWVAGTPLKPHIHWLQQAAEMPNWLLGVKWYRIGEATTLGTDFSAHALTPYTTNAFVHPGGVIHQITSFPDISTVGVDISDCLHVCLWRDSLNTSTEFDGADPSNITEQVLEFDIHHRVNSFGSQGVFTKT